MDVKLIIIGFGRIGGLIADSLVEEDKAADIGFSRATILVTSEENDVDDLEYIEREDRIFISSSKFNYNLTNSGLEATSETIRDYSGEILSSIEDIKKSEIDGFLFTTAMDNHVGIGGIPILVKRLSELYPEIPMFGLGTIPNQSDPKSSQLITRAIKSFQMNLHTLFLVDVDKWREQIKPREKNEMDDFNAIRAAVKRFGLLFSLDNESPISTTGYGLQRNVLEDILSGGRIASVGSAVNRIDSLQDTNTKGLLLRLRGMFSSNIDESKISESFLSLVQNASAEQLSIDCKIDTSDRIILIFGGPQVCLSERIIAPARNWLAGRAGKSNLKEVRYPFQDSAYIVAMTIIAGPTDIPKIQQITETVETEIEKTESPVMHQNSQETRDLFDPLAESTADEGTAQHPASDDLIDNSDLDTSNTGDSHSRGIGPSEEISTERSINGTLEPQDQSPKSSRNSMKEPARDVVNEKDDLGTTDDLPTDCPAPDLGKSDQHTTPRDTDPDDPVEATTHDSSDDFAEDSTDDKTASEDNHDEPITKHFEESIDSPQDSQAHRHFRSNHGYSQSGEASVGEEDDSLNDGKSTDNELKPESDDGESEKTSGTEERSVPWFESDISEQMNIARARTALLNEDLESLSIARSKTDEISTEITNIEGNQYLEESIQNLRKEANIGKYIDNRFGPELAERIVRADESIDEVIQSDAAMVEAFHEIFGRHEG